MRPVFRFKIILDEITPEIWRRIQVSEQSTFWNLNLAIQDAMGWETVPLHWFTVDDHTFGLPEDDFFTDTKYSWEYKIKDFLKVGESIKYEISFNGPWHHTLIFEAIEKKPLAHISKGYSRCLGGAGVCPPEGCGDVSGYLGLLEFLESPEKAPEEYRDILKRFQADYSKGFDPENVKFTNANRRLKKILRAYSLIK